MILSELRTKTLEHLDDPTGDEFTAGSDFARLDLLINEAYVEVVKLAETVNPRLNMLAAAASVPFTDGPEQPVVSTLGAVRRIIEVLNGTTLVPEMRFQDRNKWGDPAQDRWYSFRDSTGQVNIGQFLTATGVSYNVYYVPAIDALVDANGVPAQVPHEHHELVAMLAAVSAKIQIKRDHSELDAKFATASDLMLAAVKTGV